MEMNKPWGQVGYEAFRSRVGDEFQSLMPTWAEMSDSAQSRWEEHARKITGFVGEKYFPGDKKSQTKAFDMGQGNLDIVNHLFDD
jgi:hypothetical protein